MDISDEILTNQFITLIHDRETGILNFIDWPSVLNDY